MNNNIDEQIAIIKNLKEAIEIIENGSIDVDINDEIFIGLIEENNQIRKQYLAAIEEDLNREKHTLNKMLEDYES